MARHRALRWLGITGGVVVVLAAALYFLFSWDWLLPIVNAQASAALGRKVTVSHLHVSPGFVTRVTAEGITIDNPDGFAADKPFATIDRLSVDVGVPPFLRHRQIVLPAITVDRPQVEAERKPSGEANWNFALGASSGDPGKPSPAPEIGTLQINDGHAHVRDPKLKSDFNLAIHTTPRRDGDLGQIVMDADGTYANQPVTGRLTGGALLTLRDTSKPYPVDLRLANGPTRVSLVGTLTNPVKFEGANLKLEFAGPDMASLYPLTGIAIPETPPFTITGNLDYAERKIRFRDFAGRVGSSDLNGDIAVDPTGDRPVVEATLASRRVDLTDLGGFIGGTPGRSGGAPQSPQQKQEQARAEASPRLLPDTPIDLPKLNAANVHLRYKGQHIEGKYMPLDNIAVVLDIEDGRIRLHPVSFGVGRGEISGDVDLTPDGKQIRAKADIDFRRLDLSRIMAATHMFHGSGVIGGAAEINATGNSIASFLGNGNGGLKLFITGGGDLSALLVDLSGLQFGNALLSALGIPNRAKLECFVSDFALANGELRTRTLLLDTDEDRVTGQGGVNFRDETLNYQLRTESKHFSIGSLPAPINITGTLKNPSIRPAAGELAARGGIAAGLGVLLPPLALLPTIQLGIGEDNACAQSLKAAQRTPGAPARTGNARR